MGIKRLAAIVLAAACGIAAAAPEQQESFDIWLGGSVTIGADGRVVALEWDKQPKGRALLADRIAPVVRSWEFVPAMVDGQPATTVTGLVVHLRATGGEDGAVAVQVDSARTGPMALATRMQPPTYPADALRNGVSASVLATVEVSADGRPVIRDMQFESSSRSPGRYRKAFVASATEAIERWTLRPELVAGHAVPEPLNIPIQYCVGSAGWCERIQAREAAANAAKLPDGLHIAASSAVSLKTDVRASAI